MDSNSVIRRSETFASVAVSETLARFYCYLCAAAVTMPYSLRRRLSGLMQQAGPERSAELERLQAERLARFTLRVFASAALRSVGLEREAHECEMADTEPIDAAYAASRAEIDIPCMNEKWRITKLLLRSWQPLPKTPIAKLSMKSISSCPWPETTPRSV